jgi:restriction system protein
MKAEKSMWMVRAGVDSEYFSDFRDKKVVAIGWKEVGDLTDISQEDLVDRVASTYPAYKRRKAIITASQLFRFCSDIKEGDHVVTYDSGRRKYLIASVTGPYRYVPGQLDGLTHVRSVDWQREIDRDEISVPTKNTLGAISTLFAISEQPAYELLQLMHGERPAASERTAEGDRENQEDILRDIEERSREFIKDSLDALEWDEMQEVVAGLLRAMGYKTRVSPPGSDRGKDIVASPDGFGFESPRIVVEVKHRESTVSADQIRSFLGGRHKDDKGLYVSTAGFTKDAKYEAERAAIPLILMDLDELAASIRDHYENMDAEVRALIPLTKIYWPVRVK